MISLKSKESEKRTNLQQTRWFGCLSWCCQGLHKKYRNSKQLSKDLARSRSQCGKQENNQEVENEISQHSNRIFPTLISIVKLSGPDDNIFVFFSDHGAPGIVAFPDGSAVIIYSTILHTILKNSLNSC